MLFWFGIWSSFERLVASFPGQLAKTDCGIVLMVDAVAVSICPKKRSNPSVNMTAKKKSISGTWSRQQNHQLIAIHNNPAGESASLQSESAECFK